MRRVPLVVSMLLASIGMVGPVCWGQTEVAGQYVTGVVFQDSNGNGVRDPGEPGFEGVRVSNGRTVTTTDAEGVYRLPVQEHDTVFVIKPSGWAVATDAKGLPHFHYTHSPHGSPDLSYSGEDPTPVLHKRYAGVAPSGPLPASLDFPLYPQQEPERFRAVVLGDTQPAVQEEIYYLAHDVIQELVGIEAAFGITLGDIVDDDLSLYEDMAQLMGSVGVPWYHAHGNHDVNFCAIPDNRLTAESFKRVFGPPYYSFDYGSVHFIVLKNAYYTGTGLYDYEGRLDSVQREWLKANLALVPQDQLVVLMMHIPLTQMRDREEIFRLLETRPNTVSISAHIHLRQQHFFLGPEEGWRGEEPHHHLGHVAAGGSWWAGAPDEYGLPHATTTDGTPNGYSIITFEGNSYSIEFKASRRPADWQMTIFAPDEVSATEAAGTEVLVNVFAGSERSTVEMRVGQGPWFSMERVERGDPYYLRMLEAEEAYPHAGKKLPPLGTTMPATPSSHLWVTHLPEGLGAGMQVIHVRTTDMFGQVYTGARLIKLTDAFEPDAASPPPADP